MAMFIFDDNKVILQPENASPSVLSNLLQCKAGGMILVDQATGYVYPYPGSPTRPFEEIVTSGPFLVISDKPANLNSSSSENSLNIPHDEYHPPRSPVKSRSIFKKNRTSAC